MQKSRILKRIWKLVFRETFIQLSVTYPSLLRFHIHLQCSKEETTVFMESARPEVQTADHLLASSVTVTGHLNSLIFNLVTKN